MTKSGMETMTTDFKTDLNNLQKTLWPLFTFSRAENAARENMSKNVSEAREQMTYQKAKAIATWYLSQRKAKNQMSLDVSPQEALEAKRQEDILAQEKRKTSVEEKKKRKAEAEQCEDTKEPEPKKRRIKFLKASTEECEHWAAKSEAETKKKKAASKNTIGKRPNYRNKKQTIEETDNRSPSIRSMTLRFYPSDELREGLLNWIQIADAMDEHVKEIVERFAERGEKVSFEYVRNEYVCLSRLKYESMEKSNRLHLLRDLERRRNYLNMPYDVQQATIQESIANAKSSQTNYEKGHNRGYELRARESSRRWKTLKFLASGMRVDESTGEVKLYPQHSFIAANADRGLYVKDRLLRFLCHSETSKGYQPTKHWGNHLLCGKDKGGRAFTIRYDSLMRKWYLIIAYDAKVKGSPFRKEVLKEILFSREVGVVRAKKWIQRFENLFSHDVPKGNMCSIDPGVRVPWTCFDAHRRSFYDVYPDLVGKLADQHNSIAIYQHHQDIGGKDEGKRSAKVKERRRRKREQGKKKKRKRNWKKSYRYKINETYDRTRSIVRQAHGAFANHLVRFYDVIVLPEFMTSSMVRKRRKEMKLPPLRQYSEDTNTTVLKETSGFTLHKTTRKAMRWISHFDFRQRLFSKALADPNERKDVVCNTEEYTTKQCPFCDFVNHKIGSKKVFTCEEMTCGFRGRRDPVGGFNIGVRSIVKGEVCALM